MQSISSKKTLEHTKTEYITNTIKFQNNACIKNKLLETLNFLRDFKNGHVQNLRQLLFIFFQFLAPFLCKNLQYVVTHYQIAELYLCLGNSKIKTMRVHLYTVHT